MLAKIQESDDAGLVHKLKLFSFDNFSLGTAENHTYKTTGKARFVNPKILQEGQIRLTTDIAPELLSSFSFLQERFNTGFYVKVKGL